MSILKLHLLGAPRLERDGVSLELKRRKAIALLAYLAVTENIHSREALATLLWPNYDARRGRTFLRRELTAINRVLGEGWLAADRETVGLERQVNPSTSAGGQDLWLDVARFQQLLDVVQTHDHPPSGVCGDCLPPLIEAVDLYRDDFLRGFTLPDCPEFDEWQFFQRQELCNRLASALQCLIQWHANQKEYETALTYGRRWVSLDPLHEPAQRELMKYYALAGQQAAALRQYQECAHLLHVELGIYPEKVTSDLYEAIRTRQFPESIRLQINESQQEKREPSAKDNDRSLPPFMVLDEVSVESERFIFVARQRELNHLHTVLYAAQHDRSQINFIIGGAGRGKTMLVQEFIRQAHIAIEDLLVVTGYGNIHTGIGDPYLPFRQALTMLTGDIEGMWAGGLITASHASRLWEAMPITLSALVDFAPNLIDTFIPAQALQKRIAKLESHDAPWLSRLVEIISNPHQVNLDKKQIFAQYTAVLKGIAAERPLLFVLEDLHWVDASSISLLFHLSRELGDSPILMLGTYRPEEMALDWGDIRHPLADIVGELKRQHGDIWLDLGNISTQEGRQFVNAYLDTQPNKLSQAFREALFHQTGGHALFTTELLRHMQERGDIYRDKNNYWISGDVVEWETLPAKVEGAIEQRISRLAKELQAILRVASVEGEIFTAEVVAQVLRRNERKLVHQLSRELGDQHRLVGAQTLEQVRGQRFSRYRFRHQLIQHYLYHNLDETERAYLHEDVGKVMETLYREQTEKAAVQLARHFHKAGFIGKAVSYLLQAGKQSQRLSAFQEAINHLNKALDLLMGLPDTPERAQQELMVQITLGNVLIASKGYAAPVVKQTYDRARELCEYVGETPQLFPVLYGLWAFYGLGAEHKAAYEVAEQFLRRAQRKNDDAAIMVAYRALGSTCSLLGNPIQGRAYQEQSLALYDPGQHRHLAYIYGQDPCVGALLYLSIDLWPLGYPDQARRKIEMALNLARELSHPLTSAYALSAATIVYVNLMEPQNVQNCAKEAIALCKEYGIPFFLHWSKLNQGAALVQQGQVEEGITQMSQGLFEFRAMGAGAAIPSFLANLANGYKMAGRVSEGLTTIAEALDIVQETGELISKSELYRLMGELLLMQDQAGAEVEAETCFLKAIEIARRLNGKSLELRASVSLCRFWQKQGRNEKARQTLARIYSWFTEGFDTFDLKEARTLLDELSGGK